MKHPVAQNAAGRFYFRARFAHFRARFAPSFLAPFMG